MTVETARSSVHARTMRALAVVVGMLVVATANVQQSQSVFSSATSQSSDQEAATVSLTSNAVANFDAAGLAPGDTVTRCVEVAYDGDATRTQLDSVRLITSDPGGSGLASYLTITGAMGSAGSTCAAPGTWSPALSGTMSTLFSTHSTYDSAFDLGWKPTPTDRTRAFRFILTLPAGTPDTAQGRRATPTFTWEIRSAAGTDR